jgi:hypothetical protein
MIILTILGLCSLLYFQNLNAQDIKKEAMTVFQDYLEMHEELKAIATTGAGKESHQYKQLLTTVDSVHNYVYLRVLRRAKGYVVETGDTEMLDSFLKLVLATSHREDDYQVFAFGDMYLAQSDSVAAVYGKFNHDHQKILYKKLEKAFMRVSFRNKEVEDYEALRTKMIGLQPKE